MSESQAGKQEHTEPQGIRTETTEWCEGFALVENRPLTPDEVEALNGEAKQLRRRGWQAGCCSPLALLLPIAILASVDQKLLETPPMVVVEGILFISMPVGIAFFALKARDGLRRAKALHRDIKAAYVKRFAGELEVAADSAEAEDSGGRAKGDSVSKEPPSTQMEHIEFEVLPCSHRVWRVKGEAVEKWEEATWSEVAQTPQIACMAAAWVEPLQSRSGENSPPPTLDSGQHGQRDLSSAEKDELKRRARKAWLQPFWPALLLSLWSAMPIAVMFLEPHHKNIEIRAYILFAFTALACISFLHGALTAFRMNHDRKIGLVFIFRVPVSMLEDNRGSGAQKSDTDGANVVIEILPYTRLDWTEDGEPSAWRRVADS